MVETRPINKNPAEQTAQNYMAAVNALAEQYRQSGKPTEYLSAANAKNVLKKTIQAVVSMVNPASKNHNLAYNGLKEQMGGHAYSPAFAELQNIGEKYMGAVASFAEAGTKRGMNIEQATEHAFNSIAGNPVFDHFGNLNLLAAQLFEEQALVESFLENGDAFAVPVESGGTGSDKSRFRAPVEQVMGSAKPVNGNINPDGTMQDSQNRTQISLYNEFKNAITISTVFAITQAMRDQALGYGSAIAPALGGFVLQNRYFGASQKQVMKEAELMMAWGTDTLGNYTQGVGGSYGLLSQSVLYQVSGYDTASPTPVTNAQWAANTGALIQKITNFNFPMNGTGGASALWPTNGDPAKMYLDILRLVSLAATANVDFSPKKWVLYVPTTWYALAMQYPSGGTFNKQLQEMTTTAVGGKIIEKLEVVPSSLMNYQASGSNAYGSTGGNYNHILLVAHGCEQEKKPIIMPGETAIPYVQSESVSQSIMNFRTQYLTGGPMVMHYGGAFCMEFTKTS